jgi:hypothetical protein
MHEAWLVLVSACNESPFICFKKEKEKVCMNYAPFSSLAGLAQSTSIITYKLLETPCVRHLK